MIAVETIQFNHDLGGALNVRRDALESVTLPEWRRYACVNPEDSPAVYPTAAAQSNAITIQVTLSCTDHEIRQAEIRVPRHVREHTVNFPPSIGDADGTAAPTSTPELFELIDPPAAVAEVGVQDVEWRWEYRIPPHGDWHQMATPTRHRLYTVLDPPSAPWSQNPSSTQVPWVSALDYACYWAEGAQTKDEAARRITENVYALGPAVVQYDFPNGGATHYSNRFFDLTAFLDRLRGGRGNGRYVNCTDCATIVSTFANLVGCDLWQSQMGYSFQVNPMQVIGSPTMSESIDFYYHEVAWNGECTADYNLWDACLKVNYGANPTEAPFDLLLSCNVEFPEYRDRLASPGQGNCEPRQRTRRRRDVTYRSSVPMDREKKEHLRKHYSASKWQDRQWTEGIVVDVELTDSDIPGWTRERAKRVGHAAPPLFHSVWRNSSNDDGIITIRIIECADASAAQDQLLEELGTFHSTTVEPRDGADSIGDVSFGRVEFMALFARANVVVTILNAGPESVPVAGVARDVDMFIQRKIATGSRTS